MVFRRYIKRGGKVFGPYFYESKRVDGKVRSIYRGIGKEGKRTGEQSGMHEGAGRRVEKAKKGRSKAGVKKIEGKKQKKVKPGARQTGGNASMQDMVDEFNRRLIEIGKSISIGELEASVRHYGKIVGLYNRMKNRLPYNDSLKIYKTIEKVYNDINKIGNKTGEREGTGD